MTPVPCPSCRCVAFTVGPAGPPERRCHQCGNVFTPEGADARKRIGPSSSHTSPGAPAAGIARGSSHAQRGNTGGAAAGAAPSNPRACALSPDGLLLPDGRLVPVDPNDGGRVLELARLHELRQVWIGPAAARYIGFPESMATPRDPQKDYELHTPHRWVDAVGSSWRPSVPGVAPWIGFSDPDVPGGWVDVVIPHLDDRNPFAAARSSGELLEALYYYASTLGMRYRHSAGSTSMALMRSLDVFRDAPPSLPPPATGVGSPDSVAPWVLPPDRPTGYVHAYDVNAMYLGAAGVAELGIGTPAYHKGPPDEWRPRWPGYWRARVTPWEGPLPAPFHFDGRPYWYPTPAIDLAHEMGLRVEITEAWSWPDHRRALRPWYERLRAARTTLMDGGSPEARLALDAVKATYARGIGWLAGGWYERDEPWFRPDWRTTLIAQARANMFRHMLHVWKRTGRTPCLHGRSDFVAYWSDTSDPAACAASLGLELSRQVGKWKHAGSMAAARLAEHAGGRPRTTSLADIAKLLEAS